MAFPVDLGCDSWRFVFGSFATTATAVEPSLEFVSAVLFAVVISGAHDGRVATRIRFFCGLARCGVTGSSCVSILVVGLGVAFEKFEQEIVGTRSNGRKVNLFLFANRLELFLAFGGATAIAGSGVVGKVLVEFWALHNHW